MATIDIHFPGELRPVLAEIGALLAEAGPAAMLAKTTPPEDDDDFTALWLAGLGERIEGDTAAAMRLLTNPAFGNEPIEVPYDEAFAMLRGFTTLRLTLRETVLSGIPDEALEADRIDRRKLSATRRHALGCYALLGRLQSELCDLLED